MGVPAEDVPGGAKPGSVRSPQIVEDALTHGQVQSSGRLGLIYDKVTRIDIWQDARRSVKFQKGVAGVGQVSIDDARTYGAKRFLLKL